MEAMNVGCCRSGRPVRLGRVVHTRYNVPSSNLRASKTSFKVGSAGALFFSTGPYSDSFWSHLCKHYHVNSFGVHQNNICNIHKGAMYHGFEPDSTSNRMDQYVNGSYYHPLEEVAQLKNQNMKEQRLTAAEMSRTIIEVNNKAALLFSDVIVDARNASILLSQLSYITDEHGNVYFELYNDGAGLPTENDEDVLVHVLIGLDDAEIHSEVEILSDSGVDFEVEEIEKGAIDDYHNEGWVNILEDGESDDEEDLEPSMLDELTISEDEDSSDPAYFARKLAEVVSAPDLDTIRRPSTGVAIQGLLKPVFANVESTEQEKKSAYIHNHKYKITKHEQKGFNLDENESNGTSLYKLEMMNIELISTCGNESNVRIKDYHDARPDVLAHSAPKIISRLEEMGEKTAGALKLLCWRVNHIKVEEVELIGLDSLGFDLRVCSGAQVQTLRFPFDYRSSLIPDLLVQTPIQSGHFLDVDHGVVDILNNDQEGETRAWKCGESLWHNSIKKFLFNDLPYDFSNSGNTTCKLKHIVHVGNMDTEYGSILYDPGTFLSCKLILARRILSNRPSSKFVKCCSHDSLMAPSKVSATSGK